MIDTTTKICKSCGFTKLISEFNRSSSVLGGYRHKCKSCVKLDNDKICHLVSVDQKQCSKCKTLKLASEFRHRKASRDGLDSWCNLCNHNRLVASRKTNESKAKRKKYSYGYLRYSHAKHAAKSRGIDWLLTKLEFKELCSLPCTYCGDIIRTTGCGLDRKDSMIGYTISNVVPCCTICNTMKLNFWTYEEMLEIGKLAAALKAKRHVI